MHINHTLRRLQASVGGKSPNFTGICLVAMLGAAIAAGEAALALERPPSATLSINDDTVTEQAAVNTNGREAGFTLNINDLPIDGADNISIFYRLDGLATTVSSPLSTHPARVGISGAAGQIGVTGNGRAEINLGEHIDNNGDATVIFTLSLPGDDGNSVNENITLIIHCIRRQRHMDGIAGCNPDSLPVFLLRREDVDNNEITITARDDEFGVSVSVSDPEAAETGQDAGALTVVLSSFDEDGVSDATFGYELSGSAIPSDYEISVMDADHNADNNTITFPDANIRGTGPGAQGNAAGAAVAVIFIIPVDDLIDEDEEDVTFSITPVPANIVIPTSPHITIADNDTAAAAVTVTDGIATEPPAAGEEAVDFGTFTITLNELTLAQRGTNFRRFFFNFGFLNHDTANDLTDIPGYGDLPSGIIPASNNDFIIEYVPPGGPPEAVSVRDIGNVNIRGTADISKTDSEIYAFRVVPEHDSIPDANEHVVFGYRVFFGGTTGNEDQLRGIVNSSMNNAISILENICRRTPQVRAAIVRTINALPAYSDVTCNNTTGSQLSEITVLTIDGNETLAMPLETLQIGDFANLSSLETLTIVNNPALGSPPVGVFNGLTALRTLNLTNNNSLSRLLPNIFNGLSSLQRLNITSNGNLTNLPVGVFDELSGLQRLDITSNGNLADLTPGVFNGLSNLQRLELHTNESLISLAPGMFDSLTSLNWLDLRNNPLNRLPDNIFRELDNLTTLILHNNDIVNMTILPVGVLHPVLDTLTTLTLDERSINVISLSGTPGETEINTTTIIRTINVRRDDLTRPHTTVAVPILLEGFGTENITVGDGSGIVTLLAGVGNATIDVRIAPQIGLNIPTLSLGTPSLPDDTRQPPHATLPGRIVQVLSDANTVKFNAVGICGRTQQVQTGILEKISETNCAVVTRQQLTSITESLDLREKDITALKPHDFYDLTGLRNLNLSGNNLRALPPAAFRDLSSLNILRLTANSLTSLPPGVLENLENLTELYLDSNPLEGILPRAIFSGLSSLEVLLMDGTNLVLPTGVFRDLANLVELSIRNNRSPFSLPPRVFENLNALRSLNLTGAEPFILSEGVFNNLSGLTSLDISGNDLSTLSSTVFRDLTNLEQLILNRNNLGTLPPGVFNGLHSLQTLALADNTGLTELPEGVLDPVLDTLTELTLDSVLRGVISFEHAAGAARPGNSTMVRVIRTQPYTAVTVAINTGGNPVTAPAEITFPAGAASATFEVMIDRTAVVNGTATLTLGTVSLPRDTRASINAAIVSAVAMASTDAHILDVLPPAGICDRTQQVQDGIVDKIAEQFSEDLGCRAVTDGHLSGLDGTLDLSNTGITTLQAGDFAGLTGIDNLIINNNRLSTLPSTVFSGLRLETLLMRNNRLNTLPATVFSNIFIRPSGFPIVPPLPSLQLSRNNLETLPDGLFDNARLLRGLFLDLNRLTTLSSTVFSNLTLEVGTLRLDSNELTELPGGIFDSLGSLLTLTLNRNNLETLPDGLFDNLRGLLFLSLNDNNLETLPANLLLGTNPAALGLHNNNLTTLPDGLFDNNLNFAFRSMESVTLNGNNLMNLPPGVFDDLELLSALSLDGNPNLDTLPVGVLEPALDTFGDRGAVSGLRGFLRLDSTLTGVVSFERTAGVIPQGGSAVVRIVRTQPYATVAVAINTGGSEGSHVTVPDEITLPAGATSATFEVFIDRTAVVNGTATFTLGTLSLPADTRVPPNADIVDTIITVANTTNVHTLDILPTEGICGRTQQVLDAIVDAIGSGIACEAVTEDHLGDITGTLDLDSTGISTLKAGDFDGLTELTELRLSENSLSTLPSTVFNDLRNLIDLHLGSNRLSTLPDGLFDNMRLLQVLFLSRNRLTALSSTVLSDLSALRNLHLTDNSLESLDPAAFSKLASLRRLELASNNLNVLPDGLFDNLPNLQILDLRLNRLHSNRNSAPADSLSADTFNGLDDLRSLLLSFNAGLTELPVGILDPVLDTLTSLELGDTLMDKIAFEHAAGAVEQGGTTMVRVIRTQPHTAVRMTINAGGAQGAHATVAAGIILPAGATSATFEVRLDRQAPVMEDAVTFTLAPATFTLPADTRPTPNANIVSAVITVADTNNVHTLDIIPPNGICDRTTQVSTVIADALGLAGCGDVTGGPSQRLHRNA